ncbi:MAG TPA: septum formation initiator family protein [bacterium]|nr:septum formation initiator family protein [bacterium]HQO33253.1 septum formation initiator family protein [bacterium]HQP97954.1 septum formation initiator family protein [bacterium]
MILKSSIIHDLFTLTLMILLVTAVLVGGWCVAERHQRLAIFEKQVDRVQTEISELTGELDRLKAEAKALETDPLAWEAAVRERLGYTRKGEVVVKSETECPS